MSLYVERNLSPLFVQNPDYDAAHPDPNVPRFWRDSDASDMLLAAGAKPYFVIYDGTLNNARLWSDDSGNPNPTIPTTGGPFDWSRAGNYSNPPAKAQVQACARLAINPQSSGCHLPPGVPILFDIEACSQLNFSLIDPPEKWQSSIALTGQMAQWAREVNPKSPILSLGLPLMGNAAGPDTSAIISLDSHYLQALRGPLSGATILAYLPMWYPDWMDRPDKWFDFIDSCVRDGDRYFGEFPRYAVVSPTYWSFGADNSRDGTPVPDDLLREQLEYLHERHFETIMWLGGKSVKQIRQTNLNVVKDFIR